MRSVGCSCLDFLSLDSSAVGRPKSLTLGLWDSGTMGQLTLGQCAAGPGTTEQADGAAQRLR